MNFETSKILGGVGALLLFVSPLIGPVTAFFSSGAIGFIGFIILLIGAYGLAQYYRENGIFNNLLYGTLVGIVGGIAAVAVAVWALVVQLPDFIYKIYPSWNGDWTTLQNFTPTIDINVNDIFPFLGVVFAVIVVLFVIAIIVAIFYRKSFIQLSEKTGVHLFSTAGTVLLVGAVLVILFGIGFLLIWISTLLLAIAFFQIRPVPPPTESIPNQM